ncbi:hypothetical protein GP476_00110 (plasmid) [Aeromonas dhakensis]|uniref:hypothetical protein n=1 Tax=Aeromonas dhakensis TaxID=196024 RepID=UPI0021B268D2|nr:hypothetical protein [Aeromonas dhakensis]UXB09956.1 hypothetical protein GP476_00110 [Aeromonas dhakensis]
MFKKKSLVLVLASVMGATAAYADTRSAPTLPVWGHSPVYQNTTGTGAVTGDLKTGATLTVDPAQLQFFDADDDKQDVSKVIYSWKLDGVEFGSTASVIIPADAAGKTVSLTVTPAALTGYPDSTKVGDVNSALELSLGVVTSSAYLKIDPTAVTISYTSTATDALNGVNGVSPVAGVDTLTAYITPAPDASPNVADYTFQWIVGGVNVGTAVAGGNTYTPTAADQGKTVSVDVKTVP